MPGLQVRTPYVRLLVVEDAHELGIACEFPEQVETTRRREGDGLSIECPVIAAVENAVVLVVSCLEGTLVPLLLHLVPVYICIG